MSNLGIQEIQNAVSRLWEAGADNLDKESLEWFAEFDGIARRKCEDLSDNLMNIACVIMNDKEAGNFQDEMNAATGFNGSRSDILNSIYAGNRQQCRLSFETP